MYRVTILYSVVCLLVVTGVTIATRRSVGVNEDEIRPGFRMRITRSGMDFGKKLGLDIFMHELSRLQIPDSETTIGLTKVRLSDIRVVRFPRPRIDIVPMPHRGIEMLLSEVAAELRAKYDSGFKIGFIKFNKSGNVSIVASNMTLSLRMRIGRDSEGRPVLLGVGCTGDGRISARFTGEWSNLLNIGSTIFRSMMKNMMISQICTNTKKEMLHQMQKELLNVPVRESVAKYFELDYSLTKFPTFRRNLMEFQHKGVITMKNKPVALPFSPPLIPAFREHRDKMLYIYLTDYLLNSGFYTAFANNMTRANITIRTSELEGYMRIRCPESQCLGTLLPPMALIHPDASITFVVSENRPQHVHIRGPEVRMSGSSRVKISVTNPGEAAQWLLTASLDLQAAFSVNVAGTRIIFNVTDLQPTISITESRATTDSNFVAMVDSTLRVLTERYLLPQLRALGLSGINMPHLNDIAFVNSVILQEPTENVIVVGTDVEFNPYPSNSTNEPDLARMDPNFGDAT